MLGQGHVRRRRTLLLVALLTSAALAGSSVGALQARPPRRHKCRRQGTLTNRHDGRQLASLIQRSRTSAPGGNSNT